MNFERDGLPVGVLAVAERVADQLEDIRVRRQREDEHHLAADPGRLDEPVAGMVQVLQQLAEEKRLSLLAEPDHRVELGAGTRPGHRAQKLDVARRHLHVDQEVGAREREEEADLPRVQQDRVDLEATVGVVEHGSDERQPVVAVHDLAEHVRGLVAVEGRVQHLDLVVRLEARPRSARPLGERAQHVADVAVEVGERPAPAEVAKQLREALPLPVDVRVIAAVDRRVGLDVLGRDRRADEDQVVVVVGLPQHPLDHGVEERLGELRLAVLDEQADVVELRVAPGLVGERGDVELPAQPVDALADALVVEADPLLHRVLLLHPVACLEQFLGAGARRAKQPVVPVEALDQDGRDLPRRVLRGGSDSLGGPFPHEHKVGQ